MTAAIPAASLADLITPVAGEPADARAEAVWADLAAAANAGPSTAHLSAALAKPNVKSILQHIIAGSPYLQSLITRDLPRLERVLTQAPAVHASALIDGLATSLATETTEAGAMKLLRAFKAEIALLTALADLGGIWPVMRVTDVLTRAADAAVQGAVAFLFREAAARGRWLSAPGDPNPQSSSGYIVIGMGKYGAFELNYSSDIDLIVFFDPARARLDPQVHPATFFVRLTRDLVRLLSEHTSGGYVFRTDLRLRPDSGATQIALSTEAAFHYYETVGQNWERAAMIKARAVAGDLAAGQSLLAALSPFIWRKYLDFAAIADIHAMKRQIHAYRGFTTIGVPGHNIKLGPGGIREIEFFAQTQQLIAGGRQRDLRTARTLDCLIALAARGWTSVEAARELTDAYVTLRTIEHRLQMVADEQTHIVPADPWALERFARFAGYPSRDAFAAHLTATLTTVQRHYAILFENSPELTAHAANMVFAGEEDDPATLKALTDMGFTEPATVLTIVRAWHHGRYRAMRSSKARERLTDVQPLLIQALAQTADPDAALSHFDRFLSDLPSGVQLFALLRSKPGLLRLIADIMGSAPRLARILSRRRRLFDAVLDTGLEPGPGDAAFDVPHYAKLLAAAIPSDAGLEEKLDLARIAGSEQQFLIGLRILSGTLTPEAAGRAYAALAEALIALLHARIQRDLESQHGRFPGAGAAVVAVGKLGGREMTASSDLDVIVIYDVPEAAMTGALLSDGPRPLSAPQYFARLTQRLVSALTAQTAEGSLYEVDLRLRPSGQKGPLATSLAGFKSYQLGEAWTWEHMALTRARVVSGSPAIRAAVERAISSILISPRDPASTARDVAAMRERIAAEKGSADPWDLKYVRGGLIDIEFICQYLQLISASQNPGVLDTNTRAALAGLAAAGVISLADAQALDTSAALFSSLIGILRLMSEGTFEPKSAPRGLKARLAHAGEVPGFESLEREVANRQQAVYAIFHRLFTLASLRSLDGFTPVPPFKLQ